LVKKFTQHPGQVLGQVYLEPHGITQTAFAQHLGWTYARLNEIVNARRGVTADSALSFSEAIPQTTPEYWLDLQRDWDIFNARKEHRAIPPMECFSIHKIKLMK
jgi:addiction module HigA family antidote